jgi:hypothetical protein
MKRKIIRKRHLRRPFVRNDGTHVKKALVKKTTYYRNIQKKRQYPNDDILVEIKKGSRNITFKALDNTTFSEFNLICKEGMEDFKGILQLSNLLEHLTVKNPSDEISFSIIKNKKSNEYQLLIEKFSQGKTIPYSIKAYGEIFDSFEHPLMKKESIKYDKLKEIDLPVSFKLNKAQFKNLMAEIDSLPKKAFKNALKEIVIEADNKELKENPLKFFSNTDSSHHIVSIS